MKIKIQKFIFRIFILLLINVLLFNHLAVAKPNQYNCKKEIDEFKNAYKAILDKYDYKDSANKAADDQYHKGKNFEAKLFVMYQNALRKVARMYQANLNSTPGTESTLSPFFKQIEEYKNNKTLTLAGKIPAGTKKYVTNISKIVEDLVTQSKNSGADSISADDAYMLKNLLVHSNDFFCRTSWLAEDIDKLRKSHQYSEAQISEIVSIANSPLNRMVIALSKVTNNSDLTLVSDDANAIHASVQADLKILKDIWNEIKTNHHECIEKIKKSSPDFLQNDIQTCNYNKFLDSLDNNSITDFESILHFINANEQHHLNGYGALKTPKIQTGLDEKLLDSMIDNTFGKQKTECVDLKGKKFIHNLEYVDQKFKTDGIINCKKDGDLSNLPDSDCNKYYELVVDSINGFGLEFKLKPQPKAKKGSKSQPRITVSFDPDKTTGCSAIQPPAEPPVIEPPVTPPATNKCPTQPKIFWNGSECICPTDKPRYFEKDADKLCLSEEDFCNKDPKKIFFNNACVDRPNCTDKQAYIEKENKCEDKPAESDPEKECLERGRVWDKDSIPQCKKKNDDRRRSPINENDNGIETYDYLNELDPTVPAKGNFVPIDVPTRQPYMLPGLP